MILSGKITFFMSDKTSFMMIMQEKMYQKARIVKILCSSLPVLLLRPHSQQSGEIFRGISNT